MREKGKILSVIKVYSFKDPDGLVSKKLRSGMALDQVLTKFRDRVTEQIIRKGNVILNEGASFIFNALLGKASGPFFDEDNSHIGVGDSGEEADVGQTGLLGANIAYKKVLEGYPKVNARDIVFATWFDLPEANFYWREWTIANGPDNSAINLNRGVEDLGEKTDSLVRIIIAILSFG